MLRPWQDEEGSRRRRKRLQVLYLLDLSFSADIAKLFGVSEQTIYKRLAEFGISISTSYSDISDSELHDVVRDILTDFPNTGYCRMILFFKRSRDSCARKTSDTMLASC